MVLQYRPEISLHTEVVFIALKNVYNKAVEKAFGVQNNLLDAFSITFGDLCTMC
jgi:hypothetical protein